MLACTEGRCGTVVRVRRKMGGLRVVISNGLYLRRLRPLVRVKNRRKLQSRHCTVLSMLPSVVSKFNDVSGDTSLFGKSQLNVDPGQIKRAVTMGRWLALVVAFPCARQSHAVVTQRGAQ